MLISTSPNFCHLVKSKAFLEQQILDSSKLKEFGDNHFKFDENGRNFSKRKKKKMW